MSIRLSHVNIKPDESLIVNIDGSSEVCLAIVVTKDKRCFLTAPNSSLGITMELAESGMKQVTIAERDKAFE